MKQSNGHPVLVRLARLGYVSMLPLTLLPLVACGPTLEDVEADVPIPTEQVAVPEDAEAGGEYSAANELIGETITVSTKVTEVLTPNLFTVYDVESLRGEEILAITDIPIPEPGSNIEVTGDVMELDEAAIKSAYDVTLEPEVLEAYTGRPYLAVAAIEAVD